MGRQSKTITTAGAIASAASERQSLVLGFVGVALGFLSYLVNKTLQIPAWILWSTIIAGLAVIWILISALSNLVLIVDREAALPTVLTVVGDGADQDKPVILLEPSLLFGHSALVSIYHRDSSSGFEILLAHGTVRTVQSDQKIQVKVDEWLPGNDVLAAGVINNKSDIIGNVIVRPSVVRARPFQDHGPVIDAIE